MKTGITFDALAWEVKRQNEAKRDFKMDTRNLFMNTSPNHNLSMDLIGTDMDTPLNLTDITHRQMGKHLGIHYAYYDKMRFENPDLLATNVNSWFNLQPTEHVIRTLDGNIRAFLGSKYRRIDNYDLMNVILPILQDIDCLQVESCEITEKKLYLKVLNPRLTEDIVPGDTVQSGMIISNSEVGHGSVAVRPLVFRLVCSNGMVVNDASMRKYHSGRTNSTDETFELLSSDTLIAEDDAFIKRLRDIVTAVADEVNFSRVVELMKKAKQMPITAEIPKVVELTGKDFGLSLAETDGVLDKLIRDNDFTLFGLSNAVTRHSQDIESYDRATELETMGFDILNMGSKWFTYNHSPQKSIASVA